VSTNQRIYFDIHADSRHVATGGTDGSVRLFDLSPAEADVAVRLAGGDTLAEIAAGRGVARETVRVQLKSVLRKLDAARQSDVVRIVDRLSRHAG